MSQLILIISYAVVTRRRRDASGSSSDRSQRDLPRAKLDKIGSNLRSRRSQKEKIERGCKRQSPKDKSIIMMLTCGCECSRTAKENMKNSKTTQRKRRGDRRTGQAREKQVSPPQDAQCGKRKGKETPYETWLRMEW